ncbi:MAG TPA: response regulator [Pyrinomonadaceae bacterium]|nr:response regulator [Pyrinomonadaceae bacterium]
MKAIAREKGLTNFEPAASNLAHYARRSQGPKKQKSTSTSAILIVDVDTSNLASLTKVIEKEGFTVLVSSDGREARKILKGQPDIVAAIFKPVIPHISGPDLVRFMRREEHLRNIPVMMMTQAESIRISCEGLAAGAVVLLPEPFSPGQVQNLLHMLVDSSHAANQQKI